MTKVCPMNGCKDKQGMCIHEKMMVGIAIIVVLVVIAKVLGWF